MKRKIIPWGSASCIALLAAGLVAASGCAVAIERSASEAQESDGVAAAPIASKPPINLEQFKIGFRIAVIDCSDCHAIDQKSKSLDPRAPPLRELLSRYGDLDLGASVMLHAAAGQDGMPAHQLDRSAADAMAAYIRVIGETKARQPVS